MCFHNLLIFARRSGIKITSGLLQHYLIIKQIHSYIALPVNFVGQLPISDNFKLQAFVGPYAALCVGGKMKAEFDIMGTTLKDTYTIKPGKEDGDEETFYINPLDFGLNFGLGFQASNFVFSANYKLGLSNLESHYEDSEAENERGDYSKRYNRGFQIGVAYLFGGE